MKNIVIVGAGEGVGKETALQFGKMGYAVGLIRRDLEALETMQEELKRQNIVSYIFAADVENEQEIREAINTLYLRMGSIDTLLYNVPGPLQYGYGTVIGADVNLFKTFLTLKITNALISAQVAFPYLKKSKGALLFTSGPSDRIPYPGTGMLGTPQAGLKMLATHLEQELKKDDIYVSYIPLGNPPEYSNKDKDKIRKDIPSGFQIDERVQANQVAEILYQMVENRNPFEIVIQPGTVYGTQNI